MCIGGGKSSGGTQYQYYTNSQGQLVVGEQGLPQAAIDAGYTTNSAYQDYLQQQLTNEQISAQEQIASQQEAFNEQQLQYQQNLAAQQAADTQAQSDRQSTYDSGRAQALSDATDQINQAFAQFSPDYFQQYTNDYMSQVQDQLDYQKTTATKDLNFALARQGLADSQAKANQMGLLDEQEGRTLADQMSQAQDATNTLQNSIMSAKQNLLGQVVSAQSSASPIASDTIGGVQQALDTQNQTISGISNSANDVAASLKAVPTVSTLGDVFSGVVGSMGSYISGSQSGQASKLYYGAAGLGGTNPSSASTTIH